MSCFICAEEAEGFICSSEWEERVCPYCGHYRVSTELLSQMMSHGQLFDVSRTREWLARERFAYPTPCISTVVCILQGHK